MNPYSGIVLRLGEGSNSGNENLNAGPTALKNAYSFVADGITLDYFWISIYSAIGTPASCSIRFELQADTGAGLPSDTALASYDVTGGWVGGTQRKISPGWSATSLTVGSRYWIVVSNISAAPTVDYIGLNRGLVQPLVINPVYNNVCAPFVRRQYNGTNWTAVVVQHATTLTIRYTDGTITGLRDLKGFGYDGAWAMSATRAIGGEFQIPFESPPLNISAVGVQFLTNSPSGEVLNIYRNRTLIATVQHPVDSIMTSGEIVTIPVSFVAYPGDWVSIMTPAATANNVQITGAVITDDPDFIGLKQWGCRRVKIDSGVWTVDDLSLANIYIYLHPEQPFAPAPLNRRNSMFMR